MPGIGIGISSYFNNRQKGQKGYIQLKGLIKYHPVGRVRAKINICLGLGHAIPGRGAAKTGSHIRFASLL